MIQLTCGHVVDDMSKVHDLMLKAYDKEGNPCIEYVCYCEDCANTALAARSIAHTRKDEYEWLSGEATEPSTTILRLAESFSNHSDQDVVAFAKQVIHFINASRGIEVVIDTLKAFTVVIGDVSITGVGKVSFPSIDDAIIALNGAYISWVNPVPVFNTGNQTNVGDDDFERYSFFIQMCHDAALSLLDGKTSISLTQSKFSLAVKPE